MWHYRWNPTGSCVYEEECWCSDTELSKFTLKAIMRTSQCDIACKIPTFLNFFLSISGCDRLCCNWVLRLINFLVFISIGRSRNRRSICSDDTSTCFICKNFDDYATSITFHPFWLLYVCLWYLKGVGVPGLQIISPCYCFTVIAERQLHRVPLNWKKGNHTSGTRMIFFFFSF